MLQVLRLVSDSLGERQPPTLLPNGRVEYRRREAGQKLIVRRTSLDGVEGWTAGKCRRHNLSLLLLRRPPCRPVALRHLGSVAMPL